MHRHFVNLSASAYARHTISTAPQAGRVPSWDRQVAFTLVELLPGKYVVTASVFKATRDPVSLIDETYSVSVTTPYHETIEDDVDHLLDKVKMKRATAN
jgi:hypothetical protein